MYCENKNRNTLCVKTLSPNRVKLRKKYKNLGIATGHAMIGLTLGTATGKLMAEAFNGDTPSMDIGIFGVDRYA
jgi:D-amino-acid dehydrogenase